MRQNGKTAVFVTHLINEAMEVGDRILVFHRPARIALEARVDRDAGESGRRELYEKILQVLGHEYAPERAGA